MILGLKDEQMTLTGNSTIKINRDGMVDLPAGFKHPVYLEPNLGTYSEPSASSN